MFRIQHRLHYLLKKDINELYLTHAIRSFAISMIGLFIPIYLLQQGYSFSEIGVFLLIHYGIAIPLSFIALKLAAKKGVKHTMLFSVPLAILFFLALYNLEFLKNATGNIWTITIIAIIGAATGAFYWMGFHVEFAKFSEEKRSIKQIGFANILATMASATGPLIGGLIITFSGFPLMFIIVIVLLIISILPLFMSKEKHVPFKFKLKEISSGKMKSMVYPFFSEGVYSTASEIAWPLLLYIIFVSTTNIGGLYAVATILIVLVSWLISHRITEATKILVLKLGTFLNSASMIARALVQNFLALNIIMGVGGVSWAMINLPYTSMFYGNSKKDGIAHTVFFREFYLNIGRVFLILIFLLLLLFIPAQDTLASLVFIGAVAILALGSLRSTNKVKNTQ